MKNLWIAREQSGGLSLFNNKPEFKTMGRYGYWSAGRYARIGIGSSKDCPEVTFENSPMQVELKLKERNGN